MKRRLNRAYDRMTMPDHCTQRIEKALQRELRKQKTMQALPKDTSIRYVTPSRKKGSIWATAAAAVLLVLVVSVGGVGLFLRLPRQEMSEPPAVSEPKVTEITVPTTEPTPEDHYAAATSLPASVVEAAAEEIRQAVLEEDWNTFYQYLYGSYQRGDLPLQYPEEFADYMALYGMQESFRQAIEEESCRKMFCNTDDGIMMGGAGQIWLYEIDGKLKITAINGMVGQNPLYEYELLADGSACILGYTGNAETVTIPGSIDRQPVTRLGNLAVTGTGAFEGCQTVKTVSIPGDVTQIDDNAFSNCPNLETVYVSYQVESVGNCAFEACPRLTKVSFGGDAPYGGNYVFSESENVTVYCHASADGWEETWEGRPTVVLEDNVYMGSRLYETLFLSLANGEIGNTEQEFKEAAENLGFEIIEENAVWLIYDPDVVSGCLNAKPLFGENGWVIDRVGYTVTKDGNLYHVKVENMVSGDRICFTGNTIYVEGGTPVAHPEDFRAYLASKPDEESLSREDAQKKLANILEGNGTFRTYDGDITIGEYFDRQMTEGIYGEPTHCAVMDLDGNGIQEVLLKIALEDNSDVGTLVLFAHGSDILGEVRWYRDLYLLKADGTFSWSGGASDSGIGRMEITDGQLTTRKIHWSSPASNTSATEFQMTYWKNEGEPSTKTEFDQLLAQQDAKEDIQWMRYPEEVTAAMVEVTASDADAIRDVMYRFGEAYFAGDRDAMTALLADGLAGLQPGGASYPNGVVFVDCKGIPQDSQGAGDTCNVSLEVVLEGEDSYSYLSMTLVRQPGGWRVQDYGLEK